MILYSKNEQRHKDLLAVAFDDLQKNGLLINAKKTDFFLIQIISMEYIVLKQGMNMDLARVEAIISWPDLKMVYAFCNFSSLMLLLRKV